MDAGLLWGAYHFLRPVSIAAQVDFFLKIASPDNTTLLALDHFRCPLLGAKRTSVLVLRMVVSDPKQYRTSNIDLNHSFRARTIVNYNLTFGISGWRPAPNYCWRYSLAPCDATERHIGA